MESFISYRQVVDAIAAGDGRVETDIVDLIGRMTGLNMDNYDLIRCSNLNGWYLKRRG